MRQKTLRVATLVDDVTRPRSQARVPRPCDSGQGVMAARQDGAITKKIYTIIFVICQHPNFLYACLRKFIPVRGATVVNYGGFSTIYKHLPLIRRCEGLDTRSRRNY